ncbi:MAG: oxygen-dependent coproporphyrinogen oxidase [Candidatus Margulisbacteria bacterium]|nr:oxygen-dependent coproporphyrinogen oxidase [Candidatus Margulisiibacteriota bacterium]
MRMPFDPLCATMQAQVEHAQNAICNALEGEDTKQFISDSWVRPEGGGGLSRVLENGSVFEKAGVNTSAVFGSISDSSIDMFKQLLLGQGLSSEGLEEAQFFATGVSLVIHPRNPMVPTTHANYRYFELVFPDRSVWWFGGGADLTPYYLFEEDAVHFHACHKAACDETELAFYPHFKSQCDAYFYLPHRQETRGVGGIFFDYLRDRDSAVLQTFSKRCSQAFIEAYIPIVQRRKDLTYSERAREWQLYRRGRYVEFNLLYDRGTKFGLQTQGRVESIFMSLPSVVQWPYGGLVPVDAREKVLMDVLSSPREWV